MISDNTIQKIINDLRPRIQIQIRAFRVLLYLCLIGLRFLGDNSIQFRLELLLLSSFSRVLRIKILFMYLRALYSNVFINISDSVVVKL